MQHDIHCFYYWSLKRAGDAVYSLFYLQWLGCYKEWLQLL